MTWLTQSLHWRGGLKCWKRLTAWSNLTRSETSARKPSSRTGFLLLRVCRIITVRLQAPFIVIKCNYKLFFRYIWPGLSDWLDETPVVCLFEKRLSQVCRSETISYPTCKNTCQMVVSGCFNQLAALNELLPLLLYNLGNLYLHLDLHLYL